MISFTIRNLKVFFKDKSAVFFSLLAVFIIIGLYVLFLGDIWASNLHDLPGTRFLMDSWIMAGLLAVTSVTTTMGAFGIMIEDKVKRITKDFIASPIKNSSIVGGYILSAVIIGIIMSLVTLILAEIYIVAYGGKMMSAAVFAKVLGLILLATVSNSALVLFLVSFFKSNNAFATASTIIGTLIGFLTGIYLPIGMLPEAVQWIIKIFPVSHAAVLFRQVMMETPLSESFAAAPAASLGEFKEMMGVTFTFGHTEIAPLVSVAILVGAAFAFYGLSILNLSRKNK